MNRFWYKIMSNGPKWLHRFLHRHVRGFREWWGEMDYARHRRR